MWITYVLDDAIRVGQIKVRQQFALTVTLHQGVANQVPTYCL